MIAATNRADVLDPALMRSGRLDRKIEFPHPTEEARARILQVFIYFASLTEDDSCFVYIYVKCLLRRMEHQPHSL